MQNRLAFPLLIISIVTAGIFAILSWPSSNRVDEITLATGGKNGDYYAFGQALSQVIARHSPQVKIRVIETEGTLQNLDLLNQKKAKLALVQSDVSLPSSTEAVAFLFPEVFHLIATEQSNIQRVSDLQGKRIALMPKGSGSNQLFWLLSQHYGLDEQDFEAIAVPSSQAYNLLLQGQVDALFRVMALGNIGISQLLSEGQNRLVSIDQAAALQLFKPALEATTIPRGTYNGAIPIPSENLSVISLRAVLVASQSLERNIVYEITKILFEARNELIKLNPQAALIQQPDLLEDIGFSFHPGAKDYYSQDEPSFIEKYAEPMGFLLSVGVLLISSLWQFRLWLRGRQKNRADFYNLEILSLIDQIHSIQHLEDLEMARTQLFKILKEVVVDLDEDRISPESFESFTFTWQVAVSTIRHQETLLRNFHY